MSIFWTNEAGIVRMMTDFLASWNLSRQRFDDSLAGLTHEQLNWRLHPGTLTIGEAAIHLAGVEIWFTSQLTGESHSAHERVMQAATEGVVNDNPFPFGSADITPEFVTATLNEARRIATPILTDPSSALLEKQLKSALGPIITGHGALARMAFHPAYHHGQVYLMITAPGFPA